MLNNISKMLYKTIILGHPITQPVQTLYSGLY